MMLMILRFSITLLVYSCLLETKAWIYGCMHFIPPFAGHVDDVRA